MLNMKELREVLSEQVEKLRNDETTPGKANAMTNAIGKILSSLKLELEYYKSIGKSHNILFIESESLDKRK